MARGIFLVEARPVSPERLDEFNTWYDEVHIPQILSFDGFVSARRFGPLDEDGPFVTVYEMEADDLAAALAGWREASRRGETDRSDVVQSDPPPRTRLLTELAHSTP